MFYPYVICDYKVPHYEKDGEYGNAVEVFTPPFVSCRDVRKYEIVINQKVKG